MLRLMIHNCLQVALQAACFWPLKWGYRECRGTPIQQAKTRLVRRETFTTVVIQDLHEGRQHECGGYDPRVHMPGFAGSMRGPTV